MYDEFMDLYWLEFLAACTAIISIYVYGNGSYLAPIVGLGSQVIWIWWCIEMELTTMFLLCLAMVLTHLRNLKIMGTTIKLQELWNRYKW